RERRLLQVIQRATGATIQRLRLPTIADVVARRRESFKETLRETMAQDGLEPFRIMAEALSEEYSPTDLAAAAFKLLLGAEPDETEDKLAEPESEPLPEREGRPHGAARRREKTGSYGPPR